MTETPCFIIPVHYLIPVVLYVVRVEVLFARIRRDICWLKKYLTTNQCPLKSTKESTARGDIDDP
jgi:hypothetical protein